MNKQRVHLIIQYALAVAAGNEDWKQRELGPIHLLKYVYLADLAYAQWHGGEIYTGVSWHFHNFGPWSPAVHREIEPALTDMGARKKLLPSKYGEDDYTRWGFNNPGLAEQTEQYIDTSIVLSLKPAVMRYGSDTEGLLHYVYNTLPMLRAAPEEPLSFEDLEFRGKSHAVNPSPELSTGQRKRAEVKKKKSKRFSVNVLQRNKKSIKKGKS